MSENKKKQQSKAKKITKWVLAIFLVLIIALVSIPFLFKDKIVQIVAKTINNNINATVSFKDSDLSLFTNFPQANLSLNGISVINKAPFKGDTLYYAKELSFSMKITELFKKSDEIIALTKISTNNGQVNIKFNKADVGNYDIAIKAETENKSENKNSFSFDIQSYELENMKFSYVDVNSNIKLELQNINHSGTGNFAKDILDLNTKSEASLFLDIDNVNYFNDVAISLDAILGIDLKNSKYTFKENTGYINQLPLEFNGFIQLIDDYQLYDIKFKTPTSSFKNALALLPKQYSGNLKNINTSGNFDLNGFVKGILSKTKIPAFDISFNSKNAMFKYNDLPKAVQNIYLDAKIINKTGNTKDTYVNVNQLNFKIDDDVFSANGSVANLTANPKLNLKAKGKLNLANIGKVYPVTLENELAGILNADVSTSFDLNSIEKKNYQNIKNSGTISVNDFKYDGKDVAKPFYIAKTTISFNTNTINLKEFNAKTGNSDIAVNGSLDNFYGFLFNKEVLKGNFNLQSNNFKVSDFLTENKNKETEKNESLKIPAFLDCKFTAEAKKVVYDNINLNNVSGIIYVKDETVNLQNLKSDVFGGKIGFDGNVSTKGKKSTFKIDLKLDELNITESFTNLEMLKAIAPIAKTIEGKINSTINVSGVLKQDMTPDLQTITGKLFGELFNTKLKAGNSKTLSLLNEKVSFLDTDKLNLDKVTGYFSFKDGEVTVKPIPINYKDIGIEIGGKHGFDKSMNYDVTFNVPAKYLGAEVTNLISKLSSKDAADIKSIPIKTNLTGSFTSPTFSTNIKSATTTLVNQLIEKQKQNAIDKGKDKIKNLLGLDKKKDSTKTDSIQKPKDLIKDKTKDLIKNLFGKKNTKKKDTTKSN